MPTCPTALWSYGFTEEADLLNIYATLPPLPVVYRKTYIISSGVSLKPSSL
jgi:hypothetical protein